MERQFTTRSTSRNTAEIREPFAASLRSDPDGSIVRRVVQATCVENLRNSDASLAIAIRHQRRAHLSDAWETPDGFGPARLRPGEEIRLDFSSEETLALFYRLEEWYAACRGGVEIGERVLTVVDEKAVTVVRGRERDLLAAMLAEGDEFWDLLETLQPEALRALAFARLHQARVQAVEEFESHIANGDWGETDWQGFFDSNPWIFGQGLSLRFLDVVTAQPAYGGINVSRRGLQIGDYLLATRAAARFTVLGEIKKPGTPLLGNEFRGSVYPVGREVLGGVAQLQAACRTWVTEGAGAEANQDLLDQGIETFEPKGVLIVGSTSQLDTRDKRRSFELFRRNVANPEIVTYDELLARAQYFVQVSDDDGQSEPDTHGDVEPAYNDLPF